MRNSIRCELNSLRIVTAGFLYRAGAETTLNSGVTPANQTKERPVHELFAGAFQNKSSMWIVLVFRRKNTRIHKNGRNSWTFRFGPFFGLVYRGDSWAELALRLGCLEKGWSRQGVRLQYSTAPTTLETCSEHPFTQPIPNKLLHSKQQKECNSSSTIASCCVAWTIARTIATANSYCSDTPCGIHPFSELPRDHPKLSRKIPSFSQKYFGKFLSSGYPNRSSGIHRWGLNLSTGYPNTYFSGLSRYPQLTLVFLPGDENFRIFSWGACHENQGLSTRSV